MKEKNTGTVVKTKKDPKKDKTKLMMGIAMMIFAVAIAAGTYAYYQSTITGTVSGTILAWACANTGSASNGSVSSGTYTIGADGLKPGTSGYFQFNVKSANFKTDISIKLKYAATTNVPGNFKLCKDSACATTIAMTTAYPSTAQFSATNVAKNTNSQHTVYWDWPYGTTSETPIATGTTNKTFTINYEITCKQSATQ